MLEMLQHRHPIDTLKPVAQAEEIVAAQQIVKNVHMDQHLRSYLLQIVAQTRTHEDLALGGSPRASNRTVPMRSSDGRHSWSSLCAA